MVGTVLMFLVGIPLFGTMTLLPPMLQNLMNYPVVTTGLVTAPRGIGTMVAMFLVGAADRPGRHPADHPDRALLTAHLAMADDRLLAADGHGRRSSPRACCRGSASALSSRRSARSPSRPCRATILTQGTAIFSLMRNVGSSIGISIVVALLAENTQTVHSRLVEHLRPDNPLAQPLSGAALQPRHRLRASPRSMPR